MKIVTKELSPKLWPAFEELFGARGACGGCWCMHWRTEKGEDWDEIKGDEAKKRMHRLVKNGEAQGILAFVDDEPVGWCALGKRKEFAKLDRAPSFNCDDAEQVWSLPCFFVKAGFRKQGVAKAMLEAATKVMNKKGAKILEGYPVLIKNKKDLPAAFAWTGTLSLFESVGFRPVVKKDAGKIRVRKQI